MWIVTGLIGAALLAVLTWLVGQPATQNLPAPLSTYSLTGLLALAAGAGFLAGAVCARRLGRPHIRAFTSIATAFASGVVGAAFALVFTAAYIHSYAPWPQDLTDQAAFVAAFPMFGLCGFGVGALSGLLAGFAGGSFLALLNRLG